MVWHTRKIYISIGENLFIRDETPPIVFLVPTALKSICNVYPARIQIMCARPEVEYPADVLKRPVEVYFVANPALWAHSRASRNHTRSSLSQSTKEGWAMSRADSYLAVVCLRHGEVYRRCAGVWCARSLQAVLLCVCDGTYDTKGCEMWQAPTQFTAVMSQEIWWCSVFRCLSHYPKHENHEPMLPLRQPPWSIWMARGCCQDIRFHPLLRRKRTLPLPLLFSCQARTHVYTDRHFKNNETNHPAACIGHHGNMINPRPRAHGNLARELVVFASRSFASVVSVV